MGVPARSPFRSSSLSLRARLFVSEAVSTFGERFISEISQRSGRVLHRSSSTFLNVLHEVYIGEEAEETGELWLTHTGEFVSAKGGGLVEFSEKTFLESEVCSGRVTVLPQILSRWGFLENCSSLLEFLRFSPFFSSENL